jgi:hypothetical protein
VLVVDSSAVVEESYGQQRSDPMPRQRERHMLGYSAYGAFQLPASGNRQRLHERRERCPALQRGSTCGRRSTGRLALTPPRLTPG